ncbi:Protein EVI2A [Tinamus guttatus]|uniref:Protein EVI2A n=1 Tax=Tinamus guttatus TaxID=94827 RepID=A0A099YXT9_TINGU|nr:PREDICTED: protein EVI2A [Tinamus guttatus]KGL74221.1 Protein EVI2A [Tinamus guttatus]
MKTERCSKGHFAFFAAAFVSLCLHVSANHTGHPMVTSDTWNSTGPNPRGSLNRSEASTKVPLSTAPSSKTRATFGKQPGTSQPWATARAPSPSPVTSAVSAAGGPRDATKAKTTATKGTTKKTCEDNKPLILICFIVIAVLVLICTFLLLSTVVLANKLSYLKKAKQGKRTPRSNSDFLAANSFWPTAAGTWHRLPRERGLLMQELVPEREAALRSRAEDAAARPSKETSAPEGVLANFVVEI